MIGGSAINIADHQAGAPGLICVRFPIADVCFLFPGGAIVQFGLIAPAPPPSYTNDRGPFVRSIRYMA